MHLFGKFHIWLCGCLLAVPTTHVVAEFRVGVGQRVITPDPLLPVSGGLGTPAPATEKKGELYARAIVFEQQDTRVAIVSVDLLGFPSVLGERASANIKGLPPENVLIGASHTHSAPDCYAFPDGKGGHTGDLKYIQSVCLKIAESVNDAIGGLQPATLRVASGEVQGKIAYNYYAPDLYDREAGVLQALDAKGGVIGTLVNFAVHPEVLGADLGICSPDLVGPLRDRIESQVGGMAMFLNGALGGMVTADNRDLSRPRDAARGYWHDHRSWEECLRIGNRLADEGLRLISDAPQQENPQLACHHLHVKLPVESDTMWQIVQHSPLNYRYQEDRTISTRVNLIRLGTAKILTIPGEALPNIGFYLKRKMKGQHNFLLGLTNDAFGYIMTKVDFQSFPRYDYISRTSLGEMTGEILIQESLKLIDRNGP